MSFRLRHPIPVPIGTCQGIRQPAGGKNNRIAIFHASIRQFHAFYFPVFCQKSFYFRMKPYVRLSSSKLSLQRSRHIISVVGNRKYSSSPFRFYRTACLLKPVHHRMVIKSVKNTVKEFGICHDILKQRFHIAVIGQVASSLSGNKQLLSKFFIFFKKYDPAPHLQYRNGSHHSGSSAARHYDLFHFFLISILLWKVFFLGKIPLLRKFPFGSKRII